ncbi:hypothetical protein DNU06_03980 [Putridiphycobacter roseus]|uniref:Uncharacterized protein n=1 Tax=Putridiphycobacter roseus TaxID=2219161 RepID=A0A2W1NIM6_9FLAO|nr:hypothetical protein [Putridiphycobacter roseus]PZE17786.1 hypothetical protein DNU06_03980 [Putridiphycobacter roseus]
MDNIEKFQKLKRINEIKTILNRGEIEDVFSIEKQSISLFSNVKDLSFLGSVLVKIYKKMFKK